MPSMSRATNSTLAYRCRGELLLGWLVCGCMLDIAAFAQAEVVDTTAAQPVTTQPVTTQPADDADPAAADPAGEPTAADESATQPVDPTALDAAPPPAPPLDDVTASEQLVASSTATNGRNSLQTAEAYVGLADAQREENQYDDAAESYLTAVEIYRAIDGPFTPLAIPPLTELGDNYREANDNVNAVSAYSEARTVSRRVFGLHNVEQIDLLDRMSDSLLSLNQLAEAEAQQLEALRLVQRANAPDSDAVLAAIYKYAEWLGGRGLYQLQRDQYTRALRLIRNGSGGENDVRLVTPLLGIANTYRQERNPAGPGYAALQDAFELLRQQPERDVLALATALRDIGDWNTAFGKVGYDGSEYQRSWDMLSALPNGDQLRKQWYSGANYVLYEPLSPRGVSMDPAAVAGHVLVRFDIDTGGNPSNVTLLESNPPGFKDDAVLRHIRRSRFRPWIVDGASAPGRGLAIRVDFRYLPDAVAAQNND
jgi:TonB family protein